jgi:hypothetical protein
VELGTYTCGLLDGFSVQLAEGRMFGIAEVEAACFVGLIIGCEVLVSWYVSVRRSSTYGASGVSQLEARRRTSTTPAS